MNAFAEQQSNTALLQINDAPKTIKSLGAADDRIQRSLWKNILSIQFQLSPPSTNYKCYPQFVTGNKLTITVA